MSLRGAAFPILVSLVGCSGAAREPLLYGLALPAPERRAAPLPVRASVDPVRAAPELERANLVWRGEDPVEIRFDADRRWTAFPAAMVRDAFVDRARDGGWFEEVREAAESGPSTHGVRMRLRAFEQVVRSVKPAEDAKPEEAWFARIDLEIEMEPRPPGGTGVPVYRFRKEARASQRNPRGVAAALSGLLAEAFDGFLAQAAPRLGKP